MCVCVCVCVCVYTGQKFAVSTFFKTSSLLYLYDQNALKE